MNFISRYVDSESHVNKASVWMLAKNNIVLMLCNLHNYTFQVDDTMIPSGEQKLQPLVKQKLLPWRNLAPQVHRYTHIKEENRLCLFSVQG